MAVQIKLDGRTSDVEIINKKDNLLEIKVDDKVYNIDLIHTNEGTFSILDNGHSCDIELIQGDKPKNYIAYTLYNTYNLEVLDAEAQYLQNRSAGGAENGENNISSPMPGKIVKVMVSEGDSIKEGETAVIISAMKMESEYKSPKDGIVKKVHVKEDDTIEGNQILIEIE